MTHEEKGTVKLLMETQTFASGFCKREFVLVTESKFGNELKFECVKEKTELLDNVRPGDEVAVKFDIQGREYNGKYFVSLVAWGVVNKSDRVEADPQGFDNGVIEDDQLAF